MLRIGLTGGIASGKSTVAQMFRELGAAIVDTDLIARQVVEPGRPGLKLIARRFGPEVLLPSGGLDRTKLRDIIFSDPEARDMLNGILHPLVAAEANAQLDALDAVGETKIALVDVPLLYEVGWDSLFPIVILVYIPPALQKARLMARDKVDEASAENALASQLPITEKRKKAQFLVDNSHGIEETRMQVAALWETLGEVAAGRH